MSIRPAIRTLVALAIVAMMALPSMAGQVEITDLRYSGNDEAARVVLELTGPATYVVNRIENPDRVYIDLNNSRIRDNLTRPITVGKGALGEIRASQYDERTSRVVMEVAPGYSYNAFALDNPSRVVLDFKKIGTPKAEPSNDTRQSTMESALAKLRELEKKKAILRAQIRAQEKLQQAETVASAPKPAQVKPSIKQEKIALAPLPKLDVRTHVDKPASRPAPKVEVIKDEMPTPAPEPRVAPRITIDEQKRQAAIAMAKKRAEVMHEPEMEAMPAPQKPEIVIKKSEPRVIATGKFKRHRIVVDAGHGGKDPGAIAYGLREKDVVLDIAKRLKSKLEAMGGGYEVILTRNRDKFLELEGRSAFANDKDADIFVSIHANASLNSRTRGLETYYLNMNSDEDTIKVAARENQVPIEKMREAVNEFDMILTSLSVQNKGYESAKLAKDVLENMYTSVEKRYHGVTSREPKMGPFYVLYGSRMPSVLVEVSYITNQTEAKRLRTSTYRDYLAEGIAVGLRDYLKKASKAAEIARR